MYDLLSSVEEHCFKNIVVQPKLGPIDFHCMYKNIFFQMITFCVPQKKVRHQGFEAT